MQCVAGLFGDDSNNLYFFLLQYYCRSGRSDVRPAEDDESSSLDPTVSTDDHSDWFDGLSKHVRLAAFVSPSLEFKTSLLRKYIIIMEFIF